MPVFQMSWLQEDKRVFLGCRRMLAEARETFQRKKALQGASDLAENISRSFRQALTATREGYDNAEDQDESVRAAARELQSASADMQETIARTQGVRVEWTESLDRMEGMISRIRDRAARMRERIDHVGKIQRSLDELGYRTNISSLNAIVNADRTVENGHIFAAVAEETRKASLETAECIAEMLGKTGEIHRAMETAGDRFTRFDGAMADFRKTSDAVVSLSGDIVSLTATPEETLLDIRSTVAAVGRYTGKSKRRYRAVRGTESRVAGFLDALDHILTTRKGVWGPYRLNKTISLDNQRINVEGVKGVVDGNEAIILQEREDLDRHVAAVEDAASRMPSVSESFGKMIGTVETARGVMDRDAAGGLAALNGQGRRFEAEIGRIRSFMNDIRGIKQKMQDTILFNGLLPLVAGMAALLAEGDHDLRFRVAELDGLLKRLRSATRDIDAFLSDADGDVTDMAGMYGQAASELDRNERTARSIAAALENVLSTAGHRRRRIDAIGEALEVIRGALSSNRQCADRIEAETGRLNDAIKDYIAILDRRKD